MELVEKGKENLATNDAYTIAALLVIEGHHKPESKHRSQPASQQARLRGASGNFCAIWLNNKTKAWRGVSLKELEVHRQRVKSFADQLRMP